MIRLVLVVALACGLAACGKKAASLSPPSGDSSGYPRTYPSS